MYKSNPRLIFKNQSVDWISSFNSNDRLNARIESTTSRISKMILN